MTSTRYQRLANRNLQAGEAAHSVSKGFLAKSVSRSSHKGRLWSAGACSRFAEASLLAWLTWPVNTSRPSL